MWPIFVEFRSASSEIRGRKQRKKERKKEEEVSVVKYKSVDMYVGRPNYDLVEKSVLRIQLLQRLGWPVAP